MRRSLIAGLRRSGFEVDAVGDGEEGLDYARHGRPDVIILDLMLPGRDGLSVLRQLRAEGNPVHVLILSARQQVAERVEGLQTGADDYLPKPFEFDELVARLQALVRRKFTAKSPVQMVGELAIDLARREATHHGTAIDLSRAEFTVLEHLLVRRGRTVGKQELVDLLYAGTDQGSENAVEVFVHQLRRKLAAAGVDDCIRTRRGFGYLIA